MWLSFFSPGKIEEVHGTNKSGNKAGGWLLVDGLRCTNLFHDTVVHHDNTVGHSHGLFLIVGDHNRGNAELLLQRADGFTQVNANFGVQR